MMLKSILGRHLLASRALRSVQSKARSDAAFIWVTAGSDFTSPPTGISSFLIDGKTVNIEVSGNRITTSIDED